MSKLGIVSYSPRVARVGASILAVAAVGIWWQTQQGERRAAALKSEVTVQQSPASTSSPAATASPQTTSSPIPNSTSNSVHRESGGTTVDVNNQSSQSGSGSNYNSDSTSVTISGQSSTTTTTTVNGHTTTQTNP